MELIDRLLHGPVVKKGKIPGSEYMPEIERLERVSLWTYRRDVAEAHKEFKQRTAS